MTYLSHVRTLSSNPPPPLQVSQRSCDVRLKRGRMRRRLCASGCRCPIQSHTRLHASRRDGARAPSARRAIRPLPAACRPLAPSAAFDNGLPA
jgi:hypothetical protein